MSREERVGDIWSAKIRLGEGYKWEVAHYLILEIRHLLSMTDGELIWTYTLLPLDPKVDNTTSLEMSERISDTKYAWQYVA